MYMYIHPNISCNFFLSVAVYRRFSYAEIGIRFKKKKKTKIQQILYFNNSYVF